MKRNPKQQLIALMEGIGIQRIISDKSLLGHLESSPSELREAGMTIGRLAHIGMEAVNKQWDEDHKEEDTEKSDHIVLTPPAPPS